jgi:tetratricopeptide (TPR) repeat protein
MAVPPPGTARLHSLLGAALEWCGLRDGAAQAFRDAIKDAPDHAHTWFRLGDALARGGRWVEAREAFTEAARRSPESPEYHGNLALACARASDGDGAVRALRRLAELRPHDAEAYVLLGGMLKKLRRHDEAIRAFRWAVRLRPSPSTQRFVLGEALLGERGWREAMTAWDDARRLPPEAEALREPDLGRSALHRHPGRPLTPTSRIPVSAARSASAGRNKAERRPPRRAVRDFESELRREERERAILHVFREARPFPIRHGDRPATVLVAPGRGQDVARRPGKRT